MITLDLLKATRISRDIRRAQLANLTGTDEERLRLLETRRAEPWFDEAVMLSRVLCTSGIVPLITSDNLTLSTLDSPLPTDVDVWRNGGRAPLSLAVRIAVRFGLSDPCELSVSPLMRQMWDVCQANERHPEAPGWCPWCAADIIGGDPHLETCLPNNILSPHLVNADLLEAPRLTPRERMQRTKGIPAYGLKALREEREMLQREVAEVIGVHPNYYARLERADVPLTVELADVLADKFNVDRSMLYARPANA